MSFPGYARYKESGVEWMGAVPEHWEVGILTRFARMKTGHTPSRQVPEYWENCSIPWFGLADVWQLREGMVKYLGDTAEMISELGLKNSAAELLPAGTVVLSRTASVGFSGIMPVPMATTQDFWNWVCGPRLLPEFLLALFRAMMPEFQRLTMGSTHKTIYQPDAAALRVCVPPTNEQREIVAFLDEETLKIDLLTSEQRRLVDLLKEKRQAVISHAITQGVSASAPMKTSGIEGLKEVPAHWQMLKLKHISPFITVGIVVNPSELVSESGVPFIYGGDIREGVIEWQHARRISLEASDANAKTQIHEGDLLTVRVGAPGVTAVVPAACEGGNCASVMLIRRGEYNSTWLCFAMNARFVRHQVEVVQYGAAQEQFNIGHAVHFRIPTPPRREQDQIADFLERETSSIDALIAEAERAILLLQERRTALITAAVTGKIDVRGRRSTAAVAA